MAGQVAATLFTRGQPGEADNRGESMVQKHLEKLQQEKEVAALEKLAALMPQMGSMVRALALAECGWDVDEALGMLRQFQVSHLDKLDALSKKRKKLLEAVDEAAAAGTEDDGPSSSDADSDDSADKPSRKHKQKRSSKESKKHKHSKSKKARKEKADKHKRRKPEAAPEHAEHRFGIIRESDMAAKRSEFMLWAMDEKKADVEALQKWEEKELWKDYVDEYNTESLPHRRYYDLQAYEREKRAKAAKKAAGKEPVAKEKTAFNDEEELRRQRAAERLRENEQRLAEAYRQLQGSDKAADMRHQELLRAEAALAYKTGDTARAQRILDRLAPDDPQKKER
eukprot:jgi/Chrzof1/594/Cz01g21190.t1